MAFTIMYMNRLSLPLITLAACAIFCATLAYWIVTLMTPAPQALGAATVRAPVELTAAEHLFGEDRVQDTRFRLAGILSLGSGRGAAAIVSVDGAPARAIPIGGTIASDVTLSEVRARSIVIDRHGIHSEVNLNAPIAGPGAGGIIYMR